MKCPGQIRRQNLRPFFFRLTDEEATGPHTGIAHKNGWADYSSAICLNHLLNIILFPNIGLVKIAGSSDLNDCLSRGFGPCLVLKIMHADIPTARRERQADGATDSSRRAGHKDRGRTLMRRLVTGRKTS
jgi:hypothetical protein